MLPNSFSKKTIFTLLCLLAIGTTQITAQWNELGGLNSLGANDAILSTCRDGSGNVYAAGSFTNSGGKHYVAKYDGKSWSELGGLNSLGFRQLIYSVCSDPAGNIYAAGYDGIVAKYDGKSWSELGGTNATPANFFIQSLCSDAAGNIYAAGTISDSDGFGVAKYDGKSWSLLGGDNHLNANYFIQTICADSKGNIYAAGGFTNSSIRIASFDSLYSGSNPSHIGNYYVAKYDGKSWSELGGKDALGANSWINSVYSDAAGNIYAAGWFTNSSGNNYVAKFDGTSWSELGGKDALAAQDRIYSVCSDPKGNIYAGGSFWNNSGYSYIAKYDGNSWSELGGSNSFRTYDNFWSVFSDPFGNIYTGGTFENSSKKSYVAKYGPSCTPTSATINLSASGSYAWNGNTYTASGSYTYTNTNAGGCDSITTLNLTITSACTPTASSQTVNACTSYLWNGTTYTTSGTYTFTTTNAAGCDSTATLILHIKTPVDAVTISGQNFNCNTGTTTQLTSNFVGGIWASSVPRYVPINSTTGLISAVGADTATIKYYCATDSASLLFNVAPIRTFLSSISGSATVCAGSTVQLQSNVLADKQNVLFGATGIWTVGNSGRASIDQNGLLNGYAPGGNALVVYKLTNKFGCKGTMQYNVNVNPLPAIKASISANGRSTFKVGNTYPFTATPAGGSWSTNNAIASIVSSTTSAATAKINGAGSFGIVYKTAPDVNGCSASTTFIRNASTALDPISDTLGNTLETAISLSNTVSIYPNPAKGVVTVNSPSVSANTSLLITDLAGKIVKTQAVTNKQTKVNISNLTQGVYFISIISADGKTTKKLVVE